MSTTTFSTQTIGRTEKALNAILDRELRGTGLTEREWVTLALTAISGGGPREAMIARLDGALKTGPADAESKFAGLAGRGLIDHHGDSIALSDEGRGLHARVSGRVAEITGRLWGDLPAEDLETAGRVLGTVLARANAELAE